MHNVIPFAPGDADVFITGRGNHRLSRCFQGKKLYDVDSFDDAMYKREDLADGMVRIPAGKFLFKTTHGDSFIPYPDQDEKESIDMPSLYVDRFPVTNEQFKAFLEASNYVPSEASNFLLHWKSRKIPKGEEQYPVVYISWEDACASWAGKRLPTEKEWQYAAQTDKQNEWNWKQLKPVTRTEQYVTETLTISAIGGINPENCNLGDGMLYAVGKYPAGANPNGCKILWGAFGS